MHGLDYSGQTVNGWLVQEKFDGVRAVWTGNEFVSRSGNRYPAPAWFTASLPPVPLDGELIIDGAIPARVAARAFAGDFDEIKFVVFDSPATLGGYAQRHAEAASFMRGGCQHLRLADFSRADSADDLRPKLAALQARGGEGFMLREPDAPYIAGRSASLLKFKTS